MNTRELQLALIQLGYDVGPAGADGFVGTKTTAAVAAFQRDRKLDIQWPGTVGPKTVTAINIASVERGGSTAPIITGSYHPWLDLARKHLGLREISGAKHAPMIIKMLEALKAPFRDDETAWCGTFVGWCVATSLPNEAVPASPWGSINWLKFGAEIKTPVVGCVAVFWRGSPSSWTGHVGFIVGQDKDSWHVLGGNQDNAVTVARVGKNRVRQKGFRWPSTVPVGTEPVPMQTLSLSLSTNEA